MAHKVHPKSFRIKGLYDWDSRWFSGKNFPKMLEEDFEIRKIIGKKTAKLAVEKIEIERFPEKLSVIIFSARPGLLIGRGGEGIEELKKVLASKIFLKKPKSELKIEIKEVKNPWMSASLVAQGVAAQIEKRMPFRRILKQSAEKVMSAKAQGVRIEIAGRLNGAEIARREWLMRGRMPRQTIRAEIDYCQTQAFCTYGVIGIKVWIYKGDKFE
ncbi:MAG: 30S ribosomal protein S3 [bacterium]